MTPLVPGYIWPTDDAAWARAMAGPPGIMIMTGNNSGPGDRWSEQLENRMALLVRAGWRCVAYVRLDYLRRAMSEVETDVRRWLQWYPQITGFFFDECPSHTDILPTLQRLESISVGLSIFNTGVPVEVELYRRLPASIFVTFEGPLSNYKGRRMVGKRCAHLVYAAATKPKWPRNLGYGFSTPDGDSNPWDETLVTP